MIGLNSIARKIFGTQNDRELKAIQPIIARINELENKVRPLSDADLRGQTAAFKTRLERGEKLEALLPEAFATVREASRRVLGQRHYDVQMIGGIMLHRGRIAEMRTGEGKTLTCTSPCYLNALEGKGVHVVTVNDYLARRDAEWMGRVHNFLGLSVGIIAHGLTDAQRQRSYGSDITYGTNNEYGFDYLRDNMKFRLEDMVQRELHYAIVDEVDSILIDEARTPLIISGPSEQSTGLYYEIDGAFRKSGLQRDTDYTVDEKSKTASLTESGVDKMEAQLSIKNLYDPQNIETLHHIHQALRAHVLFKRDVEYVVNDGEVMIVDEFTGRLMPGRRWSDGLHQAIEAKEGVKIENENQTLATITFQNYFRMYKKLSGMTGTADTEATEFKQIYNLDVAIIPTNRPMIRKDESDLIYKSEDAKFKAIADEIKTTYDHGSPVLVGTISIEKSEKLSNLLKKQGIPHRVLNAKQHEREAEFVAQAGRKKAVTIATNMAGRGTDILLGGNAEYIARAEVGKAAEFTEEELQGLTPEQVAEKRAERLKAHEAEVEAAMQRWKDQCERERDEVKTLGGLYILGTERHESRRIDNQLRGRAGRQGDPGKSKFYLSLDDDLMRIFGGVNIKRFMEDDLPIEHAWINKAIANAQRKVEAHNYDIRKHLLEYDDVMNQQRKVVYSMRKEVLGRGNLSDMVFSMIEELAGAIANDFFPGGKLKKTDGQPHLDLVELNNAVNSMLALPVHIAEKDILPFNDQGLKKLIVAKAEEHYRTREKEIGEASFRDVEKMILLSTIDHLWKDHLLAMDSLREGIGLQGYGQKDPLVEYKKQAFRFFEMMMNLITTDVVRKTLTVQVQSTPRFQFEELSDLQYNVDESGELVGGKPMPGVAPLVGTGEAAAQAIPAGGFQLPPGARIEIEGLPPGVTFDDLDPATQQQILQMMAQQGLLGQLQQQAAGRGGGSAPRPSGGPAAAPKRSEAADFLGSAVQGIGADAKKPVAANPYPGANRNDPCPCGSGKKYKKCHGAGS